jgi:Ca2+-binding EF-hand superfamily protein
VQTSLLTSICKHCCEYVTHVLNLKRYDERRLKVDVLLSAGVLQDMQKGENMAQSISSITDSSLLQQILAATQNQDSNFGKFVVAQLSKDFDKIDTDGDGKITKKELKTFLTQMSQKSSQANQPLTVDDMVGIIFSKLDPNKTGSIDKNTLTAALQKITDSLFDKIDTNHDKKIDKDELKAFLAQLSKKDKKPTTDQDSDIDDRVDQIFAKLDTNNTGYIDKSALTGSNAQNFFQIVMGR